MNTDQKVVAGNSGLAKKLESEGWRLVPESGDIFFAEIIEIVGNILFRVYIQEWKSEFCIYSGYVILRDLRAISLTSVYITTVQT